MGAEAVTSGAATGAAVGTAVPGIGNVIGGVVGGLVGALSLFKGKTPHLDFNQSANLARQVAAVVSKPIVDLYGYNTPAYDKYSRTFGLIAVQKIKDRLSKNKSWQYWIGNAIQDLNDRIASAHPDMSAVIYVYCLYVGMNYDANNPAEYTAVLQNDLTLIFSASAVEFPATLPIVDGVKATSSTVAAPAGKTGSSPATPAKTTTPASAGFFGTAASDTGIVAASGLVIIGLGFYFFNKKGTSK